MTAEPGRATHEQALRDAEAWFLRHGLPDLRLFWENDIRFLEQF